MKHDDIGWERRGKEWRYTHYIKKSHKEYKCVNRYNDRDDYIDSFITDLADRSVFIAHRVDNDFHVYPEDIREVYVNNVSHYRTRKLSMVSDVPIPYLYVKGKMIRNFSNIDAEIKNLAITNRYCELSMSDIITVNSEPPSSMFIGGISMRLSGNGLKYFDLLYRDKILRMNYVKNPPTMTTTFLGLYCDAEEKRHASIEFIEGEGMLIQPSVDTGVDQFLIPFTEGEFMLNDECLSDEEKFMINLENGSVPWQDLEDLFYIIRHTPKAVINELRSAANRFY